jgi:hypothetical protein
MTFSKALSKAGPYGIARQAHVWLEQRLVGEIMVEENAITGTERPSAKDLAATDWFPLTGKEWPMQQHIRRPWQV